MKFFEKSKRISEPSASFLKMWLNFSKRCRTVSGFYCIARAGAYLGVLLEVLLQDNVLSELLVVVLEGRPGVQVRCLREAGHVVYGAGGVNKVLLEYNFKTYNVNLGYRKGKC